MRSSQRAQVHLKLLEGGDQPAGRCGPPVARVWLGPGEWVLVPGGHVWPLAPLAIRDVLRGLELSDPGRPGARYQITRVQPVAMDPSLGSALLHHTDSRTILYCRSDQIAPDAAECLAALAARTGQIVGGAAAQGSCQVSVTRVRHRDLPAGLHPAVATIRGRHVTAHVCARLIAPGLAVALSAIGAGIDCSSASSGPGPALSPGQPAVVNTGWSARCQAVGAGSRTVPSRRS